MNIDLPRFPRDLADDPDAHTAMWRQGLKLLLLELAYRTAAAGTLLPLEGLPQPLRWWYGRRYGRARKLLLKAIEAYDRALVDARTFSLDAFLSHRRNQIDDIMSAHFYSAIEEMGRIREQQATQREAAA